MTDDDDMPGDPPPLLVRYNTRTQIIKLLLILFIPALVAFAVIQTDPSEVDAATYRFLGVVVLLTLVWAILQAKRLRDRTPQIVIDQNGILNRHWHIGIVPWQNIETIAHSSTVRRGIIQQLARSRRGAYLLFTFRAPQPFVSTTTFPLSLLSRIQSSFETQEPVILEHGHDTSVNVIMNVIQEHIDAWAAKQPPDTASPT